MAFPMAVKLGSVSFRNAMLFTLHPYSGEEDAGSGRSVSNWAAS